MGEDSRRLAVYALYWAGMFPTGLLAIAGIGGAFFLLIGRSLVRMNGGAWLETICDLSPLLRRKDSPPPDLCYWETPMPTIDPFLNWLATGLDASIASLLVGLTGVVLLAVWFIAVLGIGLFLTADFWKRVH